MSLRKFIFFLMLVMLQLDDMTKLICHSNSDQYQAIET